MDFARLTENTTAESTSNFPIEQDVIYIADAIYGKGKNLLHLTENHADALFRATPNQLRLAEDAKGLNTIDMVKKLNTPDKIVDFSCFVHTQHGHYTPVRIVAGRLPQDKALLAKERKIRKAKERQTNIKKETLIYAEWVMLMTTLDFDEYAPDLLLQMYRARWQIELLFKRIKQSLHVTQLRPASLEHSKVAVLMMLILWALTEREAYAVEKFLLEKGADMARYSQWTTCAFIFQRLKTLICTMVFSFLCADKLDSWLRLQHHRSNRQQQHYEFSLARYAAP